MADFLGFLHRVIHDRILAEAASGAYEILFESSAADINGKQIAAEKGITQQGIVQNENLANGESPFTDKDQTVEQLINSSYQARFGQMRGNVSPAANSRTSLGMSGGCGPQNTNASCDSPGA